MSGTPPLAGVYAALPTPFDERRQIDPAALKHLLGYALDQKQRGLALLTDAAEDALLATDERTELVSTVSAELKGKRGFSVTLSTPATLEAVELARFSESKGAEAIVLAPPRLPGFGYRELYRHCERIVRSINIPVVLTDRPNNALASLEEEEISTLVKHVSLGGVYVPHGTKADFDRWRSRFKDRDDVALVTGCSLSFGRLKAAPVTGSICAIALLAPELSATVYKAARKNDQLRLDELAPAIDVLLRLLGPEPMPAEPEGVKRLATKFARRALEPPRIPVTAKPALIKEALRLLGHPVRAEVRPPFESAKSEARAQLEATLKQAGVLS